MAYYEILTVFFSFFVLMFISIHYLVKLVRLEYLRGWEEAKKFYYVDPKEIEKQEKMLIQEELTKENSKFSPISADLLMAYGVNKVGQLPKNIRDFYGINDSYNEVDLDSLLLREENDR